MASIRRVRKDFRKEVLRLIGSGEGNFQKLIEAADGYFGRLVGYDVVLKAFLRSEVANAVSTLRSDGHVETVGKMWKLSSLLESEDVEQISIRRLKRVRGELKEQIRLAHKHGRHEEAAMAGEMLAIVTSRLKSDDVHSEQQTQDVHAV